jgi:hypothetical protein
MRLSNVKMYLCVSASLLLLGSTANAATLWVNCGASSGLTSINAALKALQSSESRGPANINVSGACHENILVQHMNDVTLKAVNGASITDATNGAADVIDVDQSLNFTLSGFTITGGYDGVSCYGESHCRLIDNTIQGAASDGVGVYTLAWARVEGGVLQNNRWTGLLVVRGDAVANGVKIQGNFAGIDIEDGARVNLSGPLVVTGNKGSGILVVGNSTVACFRCTSTANGADGIRLQLGGAATIYSYGQPATISGNKESGVSLGDLSKAYFQGNAGPSVTGNGLTDIACNSATSATIGARAAVSDASHTTCSN